MEFNDWLDRRQNKIDEGWFDWLKKKKDAPTTEPDINKEVYQNLNIKKHTQEILNRLGVGSTNWAMEDREFYLALMRIVAGFVIGSDNDSGVKHYLRLNAHDAKIVIDKLDEIPYHDSDKTIADKFNFNNPRDFIYWIQNKIPTSQGATLQPGFSDYSSTLSRKIKHPPTNAGNTENLIAAAEEAVKQFGISRNRNAMYSAMLKLNAELIKLGSNSQMNQQPQEMPAQEQPPVENPNPIPRKGSAEHGEAP